MPDGTQFDYDVFISYSHRDKEWVKGTLLPRLEAAGLKVCIDFRDGPPDYTYKAAYDEAGALLAQLDPR